jgi:hypothetical protein
MRGIILQRSHHQMNYKMRRLLLPMETIWRDFLQPTMCRPRTADIWADICQGRTACQQQSRQLCYCNETANLWLWDADYCTKTRRPCGRVVLATLYVSAHSLCGLLERHLCKSTIVARQRQDRSAAACQHCSPAIIARLQCGAAARRWSFAPRPSQLQACDAVARPRGRFIVALQERSPSIVADLQGALCAVARQRHISAPSIAVRHQRDHCATTHR